MKSVFISVPLILMISGSSLAQDGALKTCPKSPNCVSSQAGDAKHAIAPLTYSVSRAEALARLKEILNTMERVKIVGEKEDYLHAEARSLIFRFVDDVDFYFPAAEKVIHVRSASRLGYSDLGVNRKRVEEIRKRFTQK